MRRAGRWEAAASATSVARGVTSVPLRCQAGAAGDIADAAHRQALAGWLEAHGRLDVLVNNAGICDDGPIEEQSLEDLRRVSRSTWSPCLTCAG